MKTNNNYNTIEYLNKLSLMKQMSLKDLDQAIITFEKILAMRISIEQTYPIFINLFITAQPHLPLRNQAIFKLFYSLIRLGDQNHHKILILIHNILDICQKRSQELQSSKSLKNVLGLVKKGAEKEWGAETATIFLKYYHQRLQEYLKGKSIQLQYLSQLFQILIPKYKHQFNQTIIKIIKSATSNKINILKFFLSIQTKNNQTFTLNILKQIEFKQQLQAQQFNSHKIQIRAWLECFVIFMRDQLYDDFKYLLMIFPSNINTVQDLMDRLLLMTYLQQINMIQTKINYQSLKVYLQKLDTPNLIKFGCLVYYYCQKSLQLIQFIQSKAQKQPHLLKDCFQMIGYVRQQPIFQELKLKTNLIVYLKSQQDNQSLMDKALRSLSKQQLNEAIITLLEISTKENIKPKIQTDKIFPKLSYQLFNILGITPKAQIIPYKKIPLKDYSEINLKCLKCLQKLIDIYQCQNIIPLLKKSLQSQFDKINEYTIKININNIYMIKVLLLCGIKIKTICQNLLKNYDDNDLLWIFPKVPKRILLDYTRYLSSKDKYRFRLEIYQKQLTQYEWIINQNISKLLF